MASLDGTCPWCQRDVLFIRNWFLPYNGVEPLEVHELLICPRSECRRATYRVGIGQQANSQWELATVTAQWPPAGSRPPHQALPKPVADDWAEAHKCFGVTAYKGAAAMARRATQGVCIDRKAKPGKLVAQVKELVAAGSLHQQLGEWADQVRVFGNTGAHPGDDGLDTVSKEDAEDALAFLDQLLEWTYVAPWKLQQSRARQQQP